MAAEDTRSDIVAKEEYAKLGVKWIELLAVVGMPAATLICSTAVYLANMAAMDPEKYNTMVKAMWSTVGIK